ncbi:hypothetical protein BJ742DRAFT_297648 [Cladochytrium replicatum]|nr:hypothetical protein BJ742DRAFT_297648 [Cladochytrium replicatum]
MPLSTNSGACNGGIAHSPSRFAAIATSDLAISSSLAIPISPSSPIAYQYLPPVDLQGNGSTPIDLPSTSSSSSRSKDSLPKSASGSDLLSTPPSLIPGMSPMSKEWSLYVNDDPERCSPAAPQTTMVGSYVMIPQPVYFATSQPSVNSEVYTKALSPSSSGLPYLMDQVTLAQQSGDYFVASTSTIPVHSTFVGGLPSPPTPFVDLSKSMEDVSISPAVPTYQVPRKPVFVSQAIHIDSNGNPLPHCFQLENGCSSGMYPQTEVLSLAASPLEVYEPIPVARHSYVSVPFQSPVYAYPSHVQGTLVSNCCVSPSFVSKFKRVLPSTDHKLLLPDRAPSSELRWWPFKWVLLHSTSSTTSSPQHVWSSCKHCRYQQYPFLDRNFRIVVRFHCGKRSRSLQRARRLRRS